VEWQIHPPVCFKGLQPASGKLEGSWVEAVAIAKRHIDSQDMQNANTP
jgi:hypothetical protein